MMGNTSRPAEDRPRRVGNAHEQFVDALRALNEAAHLAAKWSGRTDHPYAADLRAMAASTDKMVDQL